MIIITLFLSCLLIIGAYWNSYSNLLKQLKGPKSQPPQYNVIILAGNSDSSSQDLLARLKEELLNNSIDLGMIYDEVQKRQNIDIQKYTNTISNNSITPSVQIHPKFQSEGSERVSGLYQGRRVYAVIQKCVRNECQFVNLTFSSEEPQTPPAITEPVAAQLKLTKIKLSETIPVKSDTKSPLKIKVSKNETTNILKYAESLGVYDTVWKLIWAILSFVNGPYTLPVIAIAMPVLSVLINCYRWEKTKRAYEEPRRIRNAPDMQEILQRIVRNLQKISSEQERLNRPATINTYLKLVDDMSRRVKQVEDDLLKKELKIEEEIVVLIHKKSTHFLRTLNTVNNLAVQRKRVLTQERKHLLLLYEKESFLTTETVLKLSSADMQFDYFIDALEGALSALDHREKLQLLKIREKIDALKRDRDHLLNYFEHPSLLRLIIGSRELTDHVPRRFLISTNQNEASS